ncbi:MULTISPECIES: GNAT family N-acetyltransferase [unclassified Pseudonocardia]|uniref:GNAT family N-acetyltransferase n=1 Tax=unclassified Pseudonocardia TaxID=2619320 RepID=UPI0009600B9E|nr:MULTISPECIES: GNAT family N-acetyltransferase [unclassified Pseudonocardia]MBN9097103.1 GNAT family N-acetyltransferase [Pseudonocardia sp.]OJY42203.1 MAG: GNAT family N-acetyltransferase [Pseudonocardia sp. 73-21]
MILRDATPDDWAAIWPFLHDIVAAGETYTLPRDLDEEQARALWMSAARTVVATDDDGTVLGTAKFGPNHLGPASHIANASFMVAPAAAGRGVGRALGEHVVEQARVDGYRSMQFNAVVSTNTRAVALWRSLGFAVIATLPEGYRHATLGYVDLHIMFRTL